MDWFRQKSSKCVREPVKNVLPPPPPLNNVQKAAMSVHGGIPYIGATRAVQNRNCETAQDMG